MPSTAAENAVDQHVDRGIAIRVREYRRAGSNHALNPVVELLGRIIRISAIVFVCAGRSFCIWLREVRRPALRRPVEHKFDAANTETAVVAGVVLDGVQLLVVELVNCRKRDDIDRECLPRRGSSEYLHIVEPGAAVLNSRYAVARVQICRHAKHFFEPRGGGALEPAHAERKCSHLFHHTVRLACSQTPPYNATRRIGGVRVNTLRL